MALRRNIYVSVLGNWAATTLAFVTTVLVSRLLTPHEIGVFTIALSIAALVNALQSLGTREFLVQQVNLDDGHRHAAFGISLVTGLAASLLLLAASIPFARFYNTPELGTVVAMLAVNPLLQSFSAPIAGMLARERRFQALTAIAVASAAVSTLTAVLFSLAGFSFYSLAFATLASTAASVAGHWLLGRRFVVLRPSLRGARKIFSFGTKVYLANLLSAVQLSTSELIIGKVLGLPSAAMFHRSNSVSTIYVRFINRAVDGILTAEYAAQNRSGGDVGRAFLAATRHMSALAWPFFGAMAIFAGPVIRVLFGHQWTDAIMPMQILCIASAFWPLNSPAIGVLIGTGAVDLNLRIRIVTSVFRVALVLVAAQFSLNWVAWAVVASAMMMFVMYTRGARRRADFSARDYVMSLAPSAVATVFTLAASAAGFWAGTQLALSDVPMLALGVAATGIGWLIGLAVSKHPFLAELQLLFKRALRALGFSQAAGRPSFTGEG